MSETQNEYETEQETDAEPTGGPWEFDLELGAGDSFVWGPDGDAVAILGASVSAEEKKANGHLIAAAGTAAQEAKEMGYDPVAVQKALPKILEALEDTAEMMDHPHAPGHAARRAKVTDALASAEGSGE
jgi:hypothetical protein